MLGALRGIWSAAGLRGPRASAWHTAVRLAFDQTLENVTGVGSPPWTWSRRDQVVDVAHKAVYSFATGALADRLLKDPVLLTPRTLGASLGTGPRDSSDERGLWD